MLHRLSCAFSVLASALFFPVIVLACAVCVSGAADDPLTDAFNWSVLFLMATPYTVVGSVAGWLVYTHRRAAAKLALCRPGLDSDFYLCLPGIGFLRGD